MLVKEELRRCGAKELWFQHPECGLAFCVFCSVLVLKKKDEPLPTVVCLS
jgi:hypothetical protein